MPVVASWDFTNRRIYMSAATWHPHDIYTEYRAYRRTNESVRQYAALLRMDGNVDKGGGKATPRYVILLDGTKVIPVDGSIEPVTDITGEIFADDQTDFIDISGLVAAPRINYAPPAAEVIVKLAQSQQIWEKVIEGGLTAEEMLRIMLAALAGKRQGLGTATEMYMGNDGVTPRITLTPDANGNGTPLLDASP